MNNWLHPLQEHIEGAVEQLVRSSPGAQRAEGLEGLVFLGELHDSYPALLLHDPNLTDSAKVLYLYLLQEARSRPRGAALVMPTLEQICEVLGHARRTVVRDRTLLRIGCWITFCRRVRDDAGLFRGDVYALHSEPCPLVDVVQLDGGYMQLIDEAAQGHYDPYVCAAATAALQLIERRIATGDDPLERPDLMARRLQAVQAVRNRSGEFFSAFVEENHKDGVHAETAEAKERADDVQVQNLNLVSSKPGSNFEPGLQVVDFCESSKFEPGPSCSSSTNTNTTTTTDTGRSKFELPAHLRWPPSFEDNLKRLIYRTLCKELPDSGQHQDILDALAHQAADTHNPLRKPVGLAVTLCRLAREGKFHPVGPPPAAAGRPKANGTDVLDRMRHIEKVSRLRSEIAALERLRENAPAEGVRGAIEAQISDKRRELASVAGGEAHGR